MASVSGGIIDIAHNGLRIGTCKLKALNRAGKLGNLKVEMDKCRMRIMGLNELRWRRGDSFGKLYPVLFWWK